MARHSRSDPTGRFTGRAEAYARYRPTYPNEAVDRVMARCGLVPGSQLVDVGCGTGISTRLFAERGLRVVGIEPNADMRAAALATPAPAGAAPLFYREGKAEATGLPNHSADAILAAQAFHWFEPAAALREFHRVLRPGGWVVLLWNERDEADPFTKAYGDVIWTFPEAGALEHGRGRAGEVLLCSPLFIEAQRIVVPHAQVVDEEGLIGRAFSASYAPREPPEVDQARQALHDLFARFAAGDRVALRYETSAYLARKPLP
jgi:SAM-dependent methyltransferase